MNVLCHDVGGIHVIVEDIKGHFVTNVHIHVDSRSDFVLNVDMADYLAIFGQNIQRKKKGVAVDYWNSLCVITVDDIHSGVSEETHIIFSSDTSIVNAVTILAGWRVVREGVVGQNTNEVGVKDEIVKETGFDSRRKAVLIDVVKISNWIRIDKEII